jgi:S-formylglutathione hydrolase FrmB
LLRFAIQAIVRGVKRRFQDIWARIKKHGKSTIQFTSEILIDQGGSDEFLSRGQLLPENFVQAANSIDTNLVKYRLHEGYDHSYYFISTFIEDHIKHHASYLH